jgi:hypothetical protein
VVAGEAALTWWKCEDDQPGWIWMFPEGPASSRPDVVGAPGTIRGPLIEDRLPSELVPETSGLGAGGDPVMGRHRRQPLICLI